MTHKNISYTQILKATSLFGGIQVATIIISIIKSKFVAVLLGPTGIGITGLFMTSIAFVSTLTNFSLERSTVKNIATANGSKDLDRIATVVSVLRRLVWFTGLLGAFLTIIFSSVLSELAFGNKDYTIHFICLSSILLLNQISAGQGAVLRGMSKLSYLAKSSLFGALSGLFISIPIYYFWGVDGIVPAIILGSISTFILTYYYSRKVNINTVKVSKSVFLLESKDMIRMGLVLSLSSIVVMGEAYVVRLYIMNSGGVEDVGFYTAGFTIVAMYFGVIFTALTTDYYPRLAGVANDIKKANLLMNQQSEMTILIIAPILIIFLVFINSIIIILYSKEFTPINEMVLWAGLGIFFKAASWALGVIFISKGDVKTLFWSELSATLVMLTFNLLGYNYFGLEGLGISYFGAYLFAYIQTFLLVKYRHSFSYSKEFYKIFFFQLCLGIITFVASRWLGQSWNYIIGVFLAIISIMFTMRFIFSRTNILEVIKSKFQKKSD